MSKLVKDMIVHDYTQKFGDMTEMAVISIRGVEANDTNEIRDALRQKDIKLTVIRNNLARTIFADTALDSLREVLSGPNALAYGAESVVDVARELVELLKKFPGIELKGAILDGDLYEGEAGIVALSKFPTRDEALGQVVQLVLSPAQNLVAGIVGPGSSLAGIVKTIEEKLEKGESIAKVG